EIAADWPHPTLGWTLGRLLEHLDRSAPYLALTGPAGAGKSTLAASLAAEALATLIADPLDEALIEAFYADPIDRGMLTEQQLTAGRREAIAALQAGQPAWSVSDFWIGQSRAFAHAFLPRL